MFLQKIFFLIILPLTKNTLYLYNTDDSLSVEFYDCIIDTNLPYCRRPSEPIILQRDHSTWYCDYGGISHNFTSLIINNISINTVLHQWKSSIEKAEQYSRYIKQKQQQQLNETIDSSEIYLCQCIHPQTFGKHCEYLLPMGTTFQETINWEIEMRENNEWDAQRYSDIVCYTTLTCDYGLLCLDWRDICDGTQHCMFGYDEENCDKLEFNECEDDEYRCSNGMCIPDQYFLDGEYDCADLTDEKQLFNGTKCTNQQASYECDDRMCFRYHWSCGDGQCISNRLAFQTYEYDEQCNSLRDQYYMCELHFDWRQWTLPNGKCYHQGFESEGVVHNRSDSEACIYFIKCALSYGAEENCPCKNNFSCLNQLKNPCNSSTVQYPNGTIFTPYAYNIYQTNRDWTRATPDFIEINGSIKCRGYMISQYTSVEYSSKPNILEATLCTLKLANTVLTNLGYDEYCHNNSRTFNNRSYHFMDICEWSKECISAYRIKDGYQSCAGDEDELQNTWVSNKCSNIHHHRFRCSDEEETCLLVTTLGDHYYDCRNNWDEWWMGTETLLSKLICNNESKNDCGFIRQYIETSIRIDTNNSSDQQFQSSTIPFRTFCDTFWNLASKNDEDIEMCKQWWKCPNNQWQCHSGQCIDKGWILDGEWDCVDASDEQGLFNSITNISDYNLNIINSEELIEKFNILYSNQSFWKLCNLSIEYPCFRANVSDPLNITINRPCINLYQIGDDHIDCAGGLDERNTLQYCSSSTMLGYNFQCSSTQHCISYSSHCPDRCNDNYVQCYGYNRSINCSNEHDFMCLNGQCAESGRCDQYFDCSHGEDELLCINRIGAPDISHSRFYRQEKELSIRTTKQKLQLPRLPIDANRENVTDEIISTLQNESTVISISYKINSTISYNCNRGIGIQLENNSIVCFCPPQYYGDKCQFHIDRIIFHFHLNLSQLDYKKEFHDDKIMFQLLIIFLNRNKSLMIESFHIQLIDIINIPMKKFVHLFYSRSNQSLKLKRNRYFNRSNIINEHPYSIRIEIYQLNLNKKPQIIGIWFYPIYFDFLPSFRLTKILRLIKLDPMKNPCFSNPCNPLEECHQILNENLTYLCLCPSNFKGENCSILDQMCKNDFCSKDSLCKPNYRGLLNGNKNPFCICSLNQFGDRCNLIHDQCNEKPCRNNGTCLSTSKPNKFICLCYDHYYGDKCQFKKQSVQIFIKERPEHKAGVVQYFDINYFSLEFILIYQHIYNNIPNLLNYLHNEDKVPSIIIVKLYSNIKNEIYLISIQINVKSINITIELNQKTLCLNVNQLFEKRENINQLKYHYLCIQNQSLLCFYDKSYLCICDKNHIRSECFIYDHNFDQCSNCLSDGQCLKGGGVDELKSDFLCLCPRCHTGKFCQFNSEYFSFTVDSLFIEISLPIQIISLIFSLIIFLIGGITNYANIITFKRPNLRKTSISIYLFVFSIMSQYCLLSLILKLILIIFNILMNDITCKIFSYMLSISIRYSFWLTSCIAIERVCYLLFPFNNLLKKRSIAKTISIVTLLIVGVMHIHELIYSIYIKDPDGQSACVANYSLKIRLYDRINVLIHYIIPFCIQIFSITISILLAARSRSRSTSNNRETFIEYLKKQFQNQKELYIIPLVIIFSSLPQIILSFSFACIKLMIWQRYLLLFAYFLSYAPQLLGFILFVLPSTKYIKEFQETKLSKTIIFRWIILKKNNGRK